MYVESFGNPRTLRRGSRSGWRARSRCWRSRAGTTTRRRAGRELAHRRARGLRGGRRRAVPPGRRDPRATLEELSTSPPPLEPAAAARAAASRVLTNAGGLGILAADACDAAGLELPPLARRRARALARAPARARRASPTPSTCSARRPRETLRGTLPLILADPGIDAVITLFVPPVVAGAEEVGPRSRGAAGRRRTSRCSASCISAEGAPAALRANRRRRSRIRSRPPARSAAPPSAPTGCGGRRRACRSSTASTARRAARRDS